MWAEVARTRGSEKQIPPAAAARDDTWGIEGGSMEQYTFVRLHAREGESGTTEN